MHLSGRLDVSVVGAWICCSRMDAFQKGWFSELNEMWPGQSMSLQVEEVLHHKKSQYQDILVFKRWGRSGNGKGEGEGKGRR